MRRDIMIQFPLGLSLVALAFLGCCYVNCVKPDFTHILQDLTRAIHNQATDDALGRTLMSLPKLILFRTKITFVWTNLSAIFGTLMALKADSLTTYTLIQKIGGFVTVATRWSLADHDHECQTSSGRFNAGNENIFSNIFCWTAHLRSAVLIAHGFSSIMDVVMDAIAAGFDRYNPRRHRRVDVKTLNMSKPNRNLEQMLSRCISRTCRLPVKFGGPKNRPFPALIDTGAMMNAISANVCDEFSLDYETASIPSTAFNGTSINVGTKTTK
ncbi:hypothetical protein F5883DRAFT_588134 [Diaporthe sp. PMI_573]|nr:hypothetical protein F5883DRAFT_588134 [Diaporthaceae sp. PMI_573]